MVVDAGRMNLVEVDLPAVWPTGVRIAVAASGVNPVDAGNVDDPSWAGVTSPYVVGYECSGEVIDVGADVVGLQVGALVWACLPVRGTTWGTYATEVVLDAHFVGVRPEGIDVFGAAATPLPGLTALQVLDRLDPSPGEWILTHGASGGVGHLFVQMARRRGARIAALTRPERRQWVTRLGAEVVVDRLEAGGIERAREAAGADFAMVADFVGLSLVLESLPVVAPRGRVASIAALSGNFDEAVDKNVALLGVLVDPSMAELDRLAALIADGSVVPHVGDVMPLADAERAHWRLGLGETVGRIALDVAGGRTPTRLVS
jgi:NADPH:quinone reductase-like Zn-dependent oxidoreductase